MNKAIIVALGFLCCAGCNTVSGIGADLQAVGKSLSANAEDTAHVEAPTQGIPGCTPDYSRAPPVTCQKTTEPNRTEQVRLAPATQNAAAAPAAKTTPAGATTANKTTTKTQ